MGLLSYVKLGIVTTITSVLSLACASNEFISENKIDQNIGTGHIVGVISPVPKTSKLSIELILEGMGKKDSLPKGKISTFHFTDLKQGKYTIYIYSGHNNEYKVTTIREIDVVNDSISYVGIFTTYENELYEDWNGEKINIKDTLEKGILKGQILFHEQQEDYLKNEVNISLNLRNNLNNKWLIHKIETSHAFTIKELEPGIYTAFVEIEKTVGQTIIRRKSAYVYNIIIKPKKTAVIELKSFYNPAQYNAIDEYQPILPHFFWNAHYD